MSSRVQVLVLQEVKCMYPNLYVAMAENGRMTQAELARQMGITPKALSEKMRGIRDFKLCELKRIQTILGGSLDKLFATNVA